MDRPEVIPMRLLPTLLCTVFLACLGCSNQPPKRISADESRKSASYTTTAVAVTPAKKEVPSRKEAVPTDSKVDPKLLARLDAALAVRDPAEKNTALYRVARAASEAGATPVVKRSFAAITGNDRDRWLGECAVQLARADRPDGALEIARLIAAVPRRDEVLAQVATVSRKDGQAGPEKLLDVAGKGDGAGVRAALAQGADVNAADAKGRTALMLAAEHGHALTARLLLDHDALPNARAADGSTALILAAKNGHLDTVLVLLKYHAGVNVTDRSGMTPLMHAAHAGHVDTVQLLLAKGPSRRSRTPTSAPPTSWRPRRGRTPWSIC
jgi:hypothetical protein